MIIRPWQIPIIITVIPFTSITLGRGLYWYELFLGMSDEAAVWGCSAFAFSTFIAWLIFIAVGADYGWIKVRSKDRPYDGY